MEQFDTLLPELTVREMLLYTAELKCALAEPLSKKRARVDQLLEVLALQHCAGTLIGDTLARGISGGQVQNCLTWTIGRAGSVLPHSTAAQPACKRRV